mgnify:CR=1 FL=1
MADYLRKGALDPQNGRLLEIEEAIRKRTSGDGNGGGQEKKLGGGGANSSGVAAPVTVSELTEEESELLKSMWECVRPSTELELF